MGNAYEQEFQTDENGEINVDAPCGRIHRFRSGWRGCREVLILPDDQTVEIKAGETTTVKMHNKLVPEVPTVPQTGDSPWMPALLGALVLFGGRCPAAALLFHAPYGQRSGKLPVASDEDQGTEE